MTYNLHFKRKKRLTKEIQKEKKNKRKKFKEKVCICKYWSRMWINKSEENCYCNKSYPFIRINICVTLPQGFCLHSCVEYLVNGLVYSC
jgi:hypothetical protein